ncbi:MAG: hypothetical protein ACFBSG_04170 [Leptolyngbyaceae cyanobacterium]
MSSQSYEDKYTKPDLRRRLKEEIKASDKGGKPGQWSARKSQLLVQEYEKHGGGYKNDQKDEAAKSLEEWTEQNWQTLDGDQARGDGITKRYLPEEVWDNLSAAEKQEAERTKEAGSADGDQYVDWTPAIKQAMAEAGYAPDPNVDEPTKRKLYEQAQDLDIAGRSTMDKSELKDAIAQDGIDPDATKDELYEQAQDLDIEGRSTMDKSELKDAIADERRP